MPKQNEIKHCGNPIPTTDIIIEYAQGDKGGIVLITRKNPPYGLALPGGFAEYGISLEDNAVKEAKEETGLDVIIQNMGEPLMVRSDPSRDPRAHMISVVYVARGYGNLQAGDDAAAARIYSRDEVRQLIRDNKLAFDHGEILSSYLDNEDIEMMKYARGEQQDLGSRQHPDEHLEVRR